MYSSSLRATYGLTLRGPASRLVRTSLPSSSSFTICMSTGGFSLLATGTATAIRAAGLGGTFGAAVVLRGAGLAFAAGLGVGFTDAFAETVFLALDGLADGFFTGI